VDTEDGYHSSQCQFEDVVVKEEGAIVMYNQELPANQHRVGSFGHWNGWDTQNIEIRKV